MAGAGDGACSVVATDACSSETCEAAAAAADWCGAAADTSGGGGGGGMALVT